MDKFPLIVELKLNEINPSQRKAFMEEYKRQRKSTFTGYILLLLQGWHYAYVNRWGTQLLCWITLWGFIFWWFIDWFRLPSIIRTYNNNLAVRIMAEISFIYGNSIQNTSLQQTEISLWLKQNPQKGLNDYFKR